MAKFAHAALRRLLPGRSTAARALVGLDIGSSAIKVVELRPDPDGPRVTAFGSQRLPADCIADGEVVHPQVVVNAVRALVERCRIRTREVATSVSGRAVIVKALELPAMSAGELDAAIRWEAEPHIPFDPAEVSLAYQMVRAGGARRRPGVWPRRAANGPVQVLLAAARRHTVADYARVVTDAGLVPVAVDVDAFALQRTYAAGCGGDAGGVATTALFNVGARAVNVVILQRGRPVFVRDIETGGQLCIDRLRGELDLPVEVAEALARDEGAGRSAMGERSDRVAAAAGWVDGVLHEAREHILRELQRTTDGFAAASDGTRIERILLSGGASRLRGLEERLATQFRAGVERLDPFRGLPGAGVDGDGCLAVAAGLALRSRARRDG